MGLRALVLVCSLKPSPAPSSSALLGGQVLEELESLGVEGTVVRVVDHDVKFGVTTDEGAGDAWPEETTGTSRTAAANAVHLAGLLRASAYPAT